MRQQLARLGRSLAGRQGSQWAQSRGLSAANPAPVFDDSDAPPSHKDGKVMHPDLLNENMRKTQYAVRGELYLRAEELKKQGKEIILTNGAAWAHGALTAPPYHASARCAPLRTPASRAPRPSAPSPCPLPQHRAGRCRAPSPCSRQPPQPGRQADHLHAPGVTRAAAAQAHAAGAGRSARPRRGGTAPSSAAAHGVRPPPNCLHLRAHLAGPAAPGARLPT